MSFKKDNKNGRQASGQQASDKQISDKRISDKQASGQQQSGLLSNAQQPMSDHFTQGSIKSFLGGSTNGFIDFFKTFSEGTFSTRMSFLIMGFANLLNKQIIKGLIYLLIEIIYIIYLFTIGIPAIIGLGTLGTKTQGWEFDPNRGINVLVQGHNSMLMLISGVAAIILTVLFILVYISNVRSARLVQQLSEQGKHIPRFNDDLRDLMDSRFHITLLTVPILGIVIFTVIPLIFMILIAFTNFDANHQPPGNLFTWVGSQNFKQLLFGSTTLSKTFFPILSWTIMWAVIATFSNYIFGIIVALLINNKGIKFKKGFRTIFVLTIAVPQFVSLLIMRNMLNDYGPVNELFLSMGWITQRIPFLTDALMAKVSVLLVNLWIGIPYTMLITTGILMNIPEDLYEAARVDGASPYKMFVKITLPQILFVTLPYLITQFIGNINNFNVIYLLTNGGPTSSNYYFAGKTDLLITWLYKLTADRKDYSIASTIGIIVFVISVVISLITYTNSAAYKREDEFT